MISNPVHSYVKRRCVYASRGENLRCLKGEGSLTMKVSMEPGELEGSMQEKLLALILKIGACFLERLTVRAPVVRVSKDLPEAGEYAPL